MYKCAYYMCFKCKQPYFGGMKDCEQNQMQEQDFKPEELCCSKCSNVGGIAGITVCKDKKHGSNHIDFKCKFCCSIALWFCHGNTHYCDGCHRQAGRNKTAKCLGKGKCELQQEHPPNGTEYALGCGLCRSKAVIENHNF